MDWSIKFKQPQRNLYGHSTDSIFRFVGANARLNGEQLLASHTVTNSDV